MVAIEDFSLDVQRGEVVALVGDNGAGKSTVVKIVAGVQPPSSGAILIDGEDALLKDPGAAGGRGIQVVYQDLALAERQSVYMNLFLGRELCVPWLGKVRRGRMIAETEKLMGELDVRISSATATVSDLSGGQRQGIAIARATHWASKLVLMDEPTAVLGVAETEKVERIIVSLKGGRSGDRDRKPQSRSGVPSRRPHLRPAAGTPNRRPRLASGHSQRNRVDDYGSSKLTRVRPLSE